MHTDNLDLKSIEQNLIQAGFVNIEHLKKIQDMLCGICKVFLYAVDATGTVLTNMSGNKNEVELISQYVNQEDYDSIFDRVKGNSLEEQAVEDTALPQLKLAAISVKVHGKSVMGWIVCGVLSDAEGAAENPGFETMLSEEEFYRIIDLIALTSETIMRNKLSLVHAKEENKKSQSSQLEMTESLKKLEAITAVVQLLDRDEEIEAIMKDFLAITGSYLNVSSGHILRLRKDADSVEVVAEWCNSLAATPIDMITGREKAFYLNSDKPLVISHNTMMGSRERQYLNERGLKAIAVNPISLGGNAIGMYASFEENEENRIWKVEDVRYINDAVKILQSVLTRRIQKNSLASSYASLEAILDNVGCGIYVRDNNKSQTLFANRFLRNTFSREIKDGRLDTLILDGIPDGSSSGCCELNYRECGRWYDLYYTDITWVDGRKVSLYSLYDITDKKLYQNKIEQQAYTDFLTGLYNRMCCERDLARQIDCAKKESSTGALLYLDLDDFKHINDGLGHQYGDVLLKAISHSLQRIEGINNTCYRMGGDEFVIIVMPENFPRFDKIITDIKKIFSKPWFLKDADYYCTMSMGIVNFPEEGDNVQDLIKKADIAMYEAKKSGKNRWARYNNNEGSDSNKRLDMEKNMRDATASGYEEFEVYYQPIIDIQLDGKPCTGAEALIRWNSAELGFISPAEFIPLAEYLGLINPIGNHVLREACVTCRKWNENGHPNYKVNVNLSVVQLLQTDIVAIVERTIKETGIKPKNLTLEVTESLAINDMRRMKEILGAIKELGVRIALDDFGTGYSSLNHIREIPFDVIKVDQSFVKDLAADAFSQSFIKMIGELAEAVGANLCVEGIETKEQYKVLEGMKVRLIQGYYFGKPMPRDDFEKKYVY